MFAGIVLVGGGCSAARPEPPAASPSPLAPTSPSPSPATAPAPATATTVDACLVGTWGNASASFAMPSEGRTFPYSSGGGTQPLTLTIGTDGRAAVDFGAGGALSIHPHLGGARPEGTVDYDGVATATVRTGAPNSWEVADADFTGVAVTVLVGGASLAARVPLVQFSANGQVDGLVDPAPILRRGRFSCDERTLVVSDTGDYYAYGSAWTFTRQPG